MTTLRGRVKESKMSIDNMVSLQPAMEELERAVRWCTSDVDEIPFKLVPVIQTHGKKARCMGWFSPDQWSTREGEMVHELTIAAEILDRDPVTIVAAVRHEVVHVWNHYLGIKDVSTGGRHNKQFKEQASILGLMCADPYDSYGFGYTAPEEELKQRIEKEFKPDVAAFNLFRLVKPSTAKKVKTNAWICECSGLTLRIPAKQTLNATCHKCNKKFEPKEPEESEPVKEKPKAKKKAPPKQDKQVDPQDGPPLVADAPEAEAEEERQAAIEEGEAAEANAAAAESVTGDVVAGHVHSDGYPFHPHDGVSHGDYKVEDDGTWDHDLHAIGVEPTDFSDAPVVKKSKKKKPPVDELPAEETKKPKRARTRDKK